MSMNRMQSCEKHNKPCFSLLNVKYILLFILVICTILGTLACKKPSSEGQDIAASSSNSEEPLEREVLPQLERTSQASEGSQSEQSTLLDPFSGSLTLTGILTSKFSKDNIAIIEANNTSYIVRQDDVVAGYWNVDNIQATSILLKHGDKELILDLK